MVGVSSDDPADLKGKMADNGITWRNAVDGSKQGPIAKAWSVSVWPTFFVLDAEGTIRFADIPSDEVDAAVDELLAELEKK